MSRSSKKGVYVDEKLLIKAQIAKQKNDRRPIKTWSRRSTITPDFLGITFAVHNGKIFNNVFVTENMVGHKLGEFSPTRIFRKHSTSQDKAKAMAAGANWIVVGRPIYAADNPRAAAEGILASIS